MDNTEFHQQFIKSLQNWLKNDRGKEIGRWGDSHLVDWNNIIVQPPIYVDAELPSRESIAAALSGITTAILDHKSSLLKGIIEKTQSPIEMYMLLALFVYSHYIAYDVFLLQPETSDREFHETINEGLLTIVIQPQVKIGNYRVDFLVTCSGGRYWEYQNPVKLETTKLIVECDGHDFHERTKEQARKDKERDRELQKLGFRVFRFAGSEIYADPMKCASNVLRFLESDVSARLIRKDAV